VLEELTVHLATDVREVLDVALAPVSTAATVAA
jgi:ATP-dependent Lon protease